MIRIRQIKLNIEKDSFDAVKRKVIKILKIKTRDLKDISIVKKSIDARNKKDILYSYEVDVLVADENRVLENVKSKDVFFVKEDYYKKAISGDFRLNYRPIIVGAGPCGLFCALILAESGYRPIVIERGDRVEDRLNSVETFWKNGRLNPESNVCFGEGGAGTFSDGKLNTLVNDQDCRIKKVFDTFISCGAPLEISFESKPHIGTNVLRDVIINLRNRIISLGGDIVYHNRLSDIIIENDRIKSIMINDRKKIDCDCLVLALGHSARDTIQMLYDHNMEMETKPFAVGVRIQHLQEMINKSQYGSFSSMLPPASYKLTHKASNGRGVYTFCMCPGGYVVNSSCEKGHLIINGMSNHERDGKNSNSAIVVTIGPNDYGPNPMDGIEYQRRLEALAYRKGNGKIPVQLFGDYKNNTLSTEFGSIKPEFKGKYTFANLNEIFPYYVNDALKEGITAMDEKIKGFASSDAILAGVESRTSSAVKMVRGDDFVSNIRGVYPAGEGAGYSGGIVTSAVDGIKVAEKIIEKYSNESLSN